MLKCVNIHQFASPHGLRRPIIPCIRGCTGMGVWQGGHPARMGSSSILSRTWSKEASGTDAETILLQVLNVEKFGVHKSSSDEMLLSGVEHINSAAQRRRLGLVSAQTGPDEQAISRTYPQQPDYSDMIVFFFFFSLMLLFGVLKVICCKATKRQRDTAYRLRTRLWRLGRGNGVYSLATGGVY